MRNDSHLLKHLLTFLPPAAAGIGAAIVRAEFRPFTFDSESVFVALGCAFLVGLLFAFRLAFERRENQSQSTWIAELDVVAQPLVSLEMTLGNLAIGWMLGMVFAMSSFPQTHASTIRLLLPCITAAMAGIMLHLHLRPTQIQRIWSLADAKHGQVKLEAMLHKAIEKDDATILRAIAKMPRMKPAFLEQLAAHADPNIRADVANNPNTPPEILLTLSQDHAMEVRRAVAFNSMASIDQLRLLAKDPDGSIGDKAISRLIELEGTP